MADDRVKADAVYEKIQRFREGGSSQDDLAGALRNTTGKRYIVWAYAGQGDEAQPIIYEAGCLFDDDSAVHVKCHINDEGWKQTVESYCSAPEVRQTVENRIRKYQTVTELLGSKSPLILETTEKDLSNMPSAGSA